MADPILRRLVLHRFRSFEKEVIEFDNPTFLVGQNGLWQEQLGRCVCVPRRCDDLAAASSS